MTLSQQTLQQVAAGAKSVVKTANTSHSASTLTIFEQYETKILTVNGSSVASSYFNLDQQVALVSGRHKFKLQCKHVDSDGIDKYVEVIEIEVKPFVEYTLTCTTKKGFRVSQQNVGN